MAARLDGRRAAKVPVTDITDDRVGRRSGPVSPWMRFRTSGSALL